jgi:hypothetical protein
MFDWTAAPRPGERLLDVGCAGGNQHASDLACTVIGLDEDPAVHPTVVGNAQSMPFDTASFDAAASARLAPARPSTAPAALAASAEARHPRRTRRALPRHATRRRRTLRVGILLERSNADPIELPVELPAMVNVCVHCGAGVPSDELRRIGKLTALCPVCNRRTLYYAPHGGDV